MKQSEISSMLDALKIESSEIIPKLDVWLLKVPDGEVPSILAALGNQEGVLFSEPNYIAHTFSIPNDPEWKKQEPYLQNIQMPQAWDLPPGQTDAVVALIDSGVDASHPELASKIWINLGELGSDNEGKNKNNNGIDDDDNGYIDDWQGWNAISNNGDIQDRNGHGTHIAGIIAAESNNNMGMSGVVWGSHIMALKALGEDGKGGYAQIAKAIIYAASQGASVINLSLGSSSYSILL
ncbi:MAG: S8 family serine peptidase, partial [Anaerolineales bacterium]